MSEPQAVKPRESFTSPFLSANPPPMIEDPWSVPIEDINMIDGRLFQHEIHWEHFRRLREEDPVHLNVLPGFGRYWSITKFEDILFVDTHHELFSSAHGITIGPAIDVGPDPSELQFSNFIAMDPPKHDAGR
jgi:cytochrome P450